MGKISSQYTTWACGYFSQDIANSFQQLYTEHREEFARFWKEIAKRLKGISEILGYELMNEPWTGDFFMRYIKPSQTLKLISKQILGHERIKDAIASKNLNYIFLSGPQHPTAWKRWIHTARAFLHGSP